MITVYDMGPSKFPVDVGASPHVRKIILTLNYKSIPYEVKHLLFDEIESTAKSVGVPPTAVHPDGSAKYTIPFIHDSSTGKAVSDSLPCIEYIDQAYPDKPQVLPASTRALQAVFIDSLQARTMALVPLIAAKWPQWYSMELLQSRKRLYPDAKPPPAPTPEQRTQLWNALKVFVEGLNYGENEFLTGDKPGLVDFTLGSHLTTLKLLFGEDSEEWKDASGWNNGRAGRLVEKLLSYKRVSA
ncbi:hypothetical protein PQX77_013358 [Marasmius sp. AFHP31]|nr:hypothetical protein PQX77_013358 [Marasmius sp. AFHP31]